MSGNLEIFKENGNDHLKGSLNLHFDHEIPSPERMKIHEHKKDGYITSFVLIVKTTIGTGIFTLPFLGSRVGNPFLAFSLLFSSWVYNFVGAYYYIWAYELNMEFGRHYSSTRELSKGLFGRKGSIFDMVLLGMNACTVIAAYISLLDGQLKYYTCALFFDGEANCVPQSYFSFFSFLIVLAQSLIINRSFTYEFFGKINIFFLVIIVLILWITSLTQILTHGFQPAFQSQDFSLKTSALFFVASLYATEQNFIMFTYRFDFHHKDQVLTGMHSAYSFALVFYALTMYTCAYAVGGNALDGVIFNNYSGIFIQIAVLFYVFTGIFFCPINLFPSYYPFEHTEEYLALPRRIRNRRRFCLRFTYPVISFIMALMANNVSELITFWTSFFGPIITLIYPAVLYYETCRRLKVPFRKWIYFIIIVIWIFFQVFSLLGTFYTYF